jgi:hypothetical protein
MQAPRLSSKGRGILPNPVCANRDHHRLSYMTAVSPPKLAAISFLGGNGGMIFVTSGAQGLRRLLSDA